MHAKKIKTEPAKQEPAKNALRPDVWTLGFPHLGGPRGKVKAKDLAMVGAPAEGELKPWTRPTEGEWTMDIGGGAFSPWTPVTDEKPVSSEFRAAAEQELAAAGAEARRAAHQGTRRNAPATG